MSVAFGGVPQAVTLPNCEAFQRAFMRVFGSWSHQVVPHMPSASPIGVQRLRRGFRISSPWLGRSFVRRSVAAALCSLSVELVRAYAEANSERLCLHAGAAVLDGRLMVLVGRPRAGKSTLLAQLACAGLTIFADDALPIDAHSRGIALGTAPRLRRPLPRRSCQRLQTFAAAHRGPSDRRNLFLDLPAEQLAPFGTTRPLGCFVLLNRTAEGPAVLERTAAASALSMLVTRNIAEGAPAVDTLRRLYDLVVRASCFRLTYSSTAEAAQRLLDLDAGRAGALEVPDEAVLTPPMAQVAASAPPSGAGHGVERWSREPGLLALPLDDELFLADPGRNALHHLNGVAAAIWYLLEDQLSTAEILDMLTAAFPSVPEAEILSDLERLFASLSRSRLLTLQDASFSPP